MAAAAEADLVLPNPGGRGAEVEDAAHAALLEHVGFLWGLDVSECHVQRLEVRLTFWWRAETGSSHVLPAL